MRKSIFILLFSISSIGFAQNSIDALRYSRMDYSGTARFSGMGGSFGALGGEISGLTINPAGIGIYRNSEFTSSVGFNYYSNESSYRGSLRSDDRINFNIPNLGYVGSYQGDPNGWKNYSFGISYNRVNHFNGQSRVVGNSNNTTIIDDYVNILNDLNANVSSVENYDFPFGPSQAWQLILIDTLTTVDPVTNNPVRTYIPYIYLDEFLNTGRTVANIAQERIVETRGNQSETQFSFGGNYQDRLYLGGSIGFQRINYRQEYQFTENYTYSPAATVTDSFLITSYRENSELDINGTGVNFKIGMIYKLNDLVRLGAAIHSPTFFGLEEIYEFDARSRFASGEEFRADSITSNFQYRVTTPVRYNLSMGFILNQQGAINVDYEYVDYSTAKLNDRRNFNADFSAQNSEIERILTDAHIVRIGGEYKLNPFILRAGFIYESNPYNSGEVSFDNSRNTYSIGGGYRVKNFNFDVALNIRQTNSEQGIYDASDANILVDETERNLIMTVGWKW